MKFSEEVRIGDAIINKDSPTYIIAEAGVNHGGDIEVARKLVDAAVAANADAVKFQAFRTEHLILENISKAPYQKETTDSDEKQADMLRRLELRNDHYIALKDYCEVKGITFLITPFDEISLMELEEIGVDAYKVASTDTTNLPFLKKIAKTGKPVILSTGMCYMDEVEAALKEIYPHNKDVVLLQCTANYPIVDDEANLNVINTYMDSFDVIVGYSDHSVGLGASPYAVAMGAKMVEKHFTLDKSEDGPDHRASLDPKELIDFVKEVRRVEKFVSDDGVKRPTASEAHTRKSLQKCLVATRPIKAGDVISESDFVAKRTGGIGISPLHYQKVVGTAAVRDFNKNEILEI